MTQVGVSANRLELLQIADSVAREKSIDRTIVIAAMEDAIQKAAKSRYGSDNEIRADIDNETGEIQLTRLLEIVDTVTMEATQISLKEARTRNKAAQLSDYIAEDLPPLDFGRVAAQNAKQVIVQKVREAERERQFEEYKDRIGEVVNGIVKRVVTHDAEYRTENFLLHHLHILCCIKNEGKGKFLRIFKIFVERVDFLDGRIRRYSNPNL